MICLADRDRPTPTYQKKITNARVSDPKGIENGREEEEKPFRDRVSRAQPKGLAKCSRLRS